MRKIKSKTYTYIIIDDDYLSIDYLRDLMKIHVGFQCIDNCLDVISGVDKVNEMNPDFIFLDIDMPHLNGFQLLKYIDCSKTKVIIITAHRKYAGDSFDHFVFDFMTKPLNQDRLFESLKRLKAALDKENSFNDDLYKLTLKKKKLSYLFVTRLKEKLSIQIEKEDIYYITKLHNQLEIHTSTDGPFYIDGSLKEIIEILPEEDFSFANQSYIFNIHKAECNDGENIIFDKEKNVNLKISKPYRSNFKVKKFNT